MAVSDGDGGGRRKREQAAEAGFHPAAQSAPTHTDSGEKRKMCNRLKRLFRSIFGGIIDSAEDPELILQQLIRDMNDEVPKMRNNVAQVMATEKRLEREIQANQTSLTEIDNKIKA